MNVDSTIIVGTRLCQIVWHNRLRDFLCATWLDATSLLDAMLHAVLHISTLEDPSQPVRAKFGAKSEAHFLILRGASFGKASPVKPSLQHDLAILKKLPFKRFKKLENALTGVHDLLQRPAPALDPNLAHVLRAWLLAPFTLWPLDFQGLAEWVIERHRMGRPIPDDVSFLLKQVSEVPSIAVQQAVIGYERLVEAGDYNQFVISEEKFAEREQKLVNSKEFQRDWCWLKKRFRLDAPQNRKAVRRRSLVQERNFRPDFEFRGSNQKKRFQASFDAFCHRWNLYGMEGDRPLLLKVTVNLTAHGTMIVVPTFWSFDRRRDLRWDSIMALHKLRNDGRQGPKLSTNRVARQNEAKAARAAELSARSRGLRGEAVVNAIRRAVPSLAKSDTRSIRRRLASAD